MSTEVIEIDGVVVPQRPTWTPKTKLRMRKRPSAAERRASHLDGAPLLTEQAPCPPCGHCGKPMRLLVQLAAEDDPRAKAEALPEGTMLQAFWCADECYLQDGSGSSAPQACAARLITVGEHVAAGAQAADSSIRQKITGWKESSTTPHYLDDALPWIGDDDEQGEEWREAYLDFEGAADDETRRAGFPWLCGGSADVFARCGQCEHPMELVLQLQLEELDAAAIFGTAWILMCRDHREEVAMRWSVDG